MLKNIFKKLFSKEKKQTEFQNTAPQQNDLSFNGQSQFVFEVDDKNKQNKTMLYKASHDTEDKNNEECNVSTKDTKRDTNKEKQSKLHFIEGSKFQKEEYLNELVSTLLISLDMIDQTCGKKICSQLKDKTKEYVNKIKYKQDITSKILLSKLVQEEQIREKSEQSEELKKQIEVLEENIETKKDLMIQAEDSFGEFEKHFSRIRISFNQYRNFYLRNFLYDNCALIRQKNKKYIRTYLIKQITQAKIEETKEYKIFLRSLELWKGIEIQNEGRTFLNSEAINVVQKGCLSLLNSTSLKELNVLELSLIYVGWLDHISSYKMYKKGFYFKLS